MSKIARSYSDKHGLKDLIREFTGSEISKNLQSSDFGGEGFSSYNGDVERFQVLEFWGTVDREIVENTDLESESVTAE